MLHSKSSVTFMAENGVQLYPGSGKNPSVHPPFHDVHVFLTHEHREENGYPPRSHDCRPEETEFAQAFEEAQEDVERHEKNAHAKESARVCLEHTADHMPKVMEAIIEAEGEKQNIKFRIQFNIQFNNDNFREFQIICTMVILTKSIKVYH